MEFKIGVQNATRELVIDSELSFEDFEKALNSAMEGNRELLSLTDSRGRRVLVPVDKITYVEAGAPSPGQVGFRS